MVDEDRVNLVDEELNSVKNNREVGLWGKKGENLVSFGGM